MAKNYRIEKEPRFGLDRVIVGPGVCEVISHEAVAGVNELGVLKMLEGAYLAGNSDKALRKPRTAPVKPFELRPYHEEIRRYLEQLFKLGGIPMDTPGRRSDVTLFFNAELSFYSQLVELCGKLQVRLEAFAEEQGILLPEYWCTSRYTNEPDRPHPGAPSPGEGTQDAGSDNTKRS